MADKLFTMWGKCICIIKSKKKQKGLNFYILNIQTAHLSVRKMYRNQQANQREILRAKWKKGKAKQSNIIFSPFIDFFKSEAISKKIERK